MLDGTTPLVLTLLRHLKFQCIAHLDFARTLFAPRYATITHVQTATGKSTMAVDELFSAHIYRSGT